MSYDLDELDALDKAATPGEWLEGHADARTRECIFSLSKADELPETMVAAALSPQNRRLIVAMRNALPAMLADLKKLRKAIEHELEVCICTVREANEPVDMCKRCKRLTAILDRKE